MITKKDINHVKNIMIFLSDSLRWDYLPEKIKNMGLVIKTVSSSNCTAPSLSSMVTGLYPFRNGVFTFSDRLPKRNFNILDAEGYHTSFRTENTWTSYDCCKLNPIFRMLNQTNSISLQDIEPPFIYIEDEKGGHCPYGWSEDDIYKEGDCLSFFKDYGRKDITELKKRYEKGIKRSMDEFNKRMDIIKKRGFEEETLVIFLSDHGELLSEYGGLIGHGNMIVPELIYVPTVFINPKIEHGLIEDKLMRHVDIVPTIIDILNIKINQDFDGHSILSNGLSKIGYTYWKFKKEKEIMKKNIQVNYEERGIWDLNGGFVFKNNNIKGSSFIKATYDLVHPESIQSIYSRGRLKTHPFHFISNLCKYYSIYTSSYFRFNNPEISSDDAKIIIKRVENKKIRYDERKSLKSAIKSFKIKNM